MPDNSAPRRLGRFRRRPSVSVMVFAIVVALAVFGIYVYTTAALTVTVQPKKTKFDLGSGVSLRLNAKEFSHSLSRRAEGQSRQSRSFANRASGIIIVYNNFNSASQTLIAGTRFRSTAGFLYRSKERVVVPGKSADKPGSVEVAIVADEAGEKYNSALTDFTVPGFAGSPKYEKFYARSKTEIKGGAAGEGKVVGKAEADELLASLEAQVRDELLTTLAESIDRDATKFSNKYEYKTVLRATDPPIGSPAGTFFAEIRAEARTLAVDKPVLAETLAKALFRDQYRQGAYRIADASSLKLEGVQFDNAAKTISVVATGAVTFEWTFDAEALRREISTAPRADALSSVFANYPGIQEAAAAFSPSFLKRIPRNTKRIHIEVSSS